MKTDTFFYFLMRIHLSDSVAVHANDEDANAMGAELKANGQPNDQ